MTVRDPNFPDDATRLMDIHVSYNKGGQNYFTYKTDPRGYSLHIMPFTLVPSGTAGISFKQYSLMGAPQTSGLRFFTEGATRLNRKRLAELDAAFAVRADEIAAAFRREDYPFVRTLAASFSKNFGTVAV